MEKFKFKRLKSKGIVETSKMLLDPACDTRSIVGVFAALPQIERTRFAVFASQWARRKWGLTIDHGQAGIGCDALVSAVLKVADVEGWSTSARAANPIHIEFFQYNGFECVAETFAGKDDPTMDRPPVKISFMFRPYNDY
ncbi:hypothetical protein ACEPAG_6604 [Sanghuangporus baumii]